MNSLIEDAEAVITVLRQDKYFISSGIIRNLITAYKASITKIDQLNKEQSRWEEYDLISADTIGKMNRQIIEAEDEITKLRKELELRSGPEALYAKYLELFRENENLKNTVQMLRTREKMHETAINELVAALVPSEMG